MIEVGKQVLICRTSTFGKVVAASEPLQDNVQSYLIETKHGREWRRETELRQVN